MAKLMKQMSDSIQYKINISPDLFEQLQQIAGDRNSSVEDIIRSAISWQLLVGKVRKEGGRILIEQKKGEAPIEVSDI